MNQEEFPGALITLEGPDAREKQATWITSLNRSGRWALR
ncbi:hypothetical protein AWB81_04217 [Caballeronia arationis]|nr:hypothetical protein AWB81_04217 [Caballeronia arationis]